MVGTDHRTEEEWISEAVKSIRSKERWLSKRHPYEMKFNYWDAEGLYFFAKKEGIKSVVLSRASGDIVVTFDFSWKHPDKFTVRPDQLIELFQASPSHLDTLIKTNEVFDYGTTFGGLFSPGLTEMMAWCAGMDKEILEQAQEMKKHGVTQDIFKKFWIEMGGGAALATDKVIKRIHYFMELVTEYKVAKEKWIEDMKRLGLLK